MNPVYSTVFTSVQNGYWTDTSTWDIGSIPTTQDTIVIEHFVQGTYNLVVDSLGYLLVQSSGQLCGRDMYMTVNCGGVVDNYGTIYIDSLFISGIVTTYGLIEIFAAAYLVGPCPGAIFLITGTGSTVNIKNVECDLSALSVEHKNKAELVRVYPNPFSGTSTLRISNPEHRTTNVEVLVFDITGRKVKTYSLSKNQTALTLHANEIGMGMFFIQLVSTNELLAHSVIIISD